MDSRTVLTLKQGAAKTVFSIGVFLLVAAGAGYISALRDPAHDTSDQVTLIVVGAVLAVIGRFLRLHFAEKG